MTTKHVHPRTGLRLRLSLTAALALLALPAVQAGTPGLPFTEDFSTTTLRDDALTDANWSPEEQAVYLAWSQRRQRPNFVDGGTGGIGLTGARSVVLGDVNGDGHLDVIVGYFFQANRVYLNDGSGGFPATGTTFGAPTEPTRTLVLGDIDGDGHLDVIEGNLSGANKLFLNDGSGGFPEVGINVDSEGDGDDTTSLALGDINGNGRLDLIVGNSADIGQINKIYFNAGGSFLPAVHLGSEIESTLDVLLGDVNGDGSLDVITLGFFRARLYLNDGDGTYPQSGTLLANLSGSTRCGALGDIDGDGDLDLVICGAPNPVFFNDGTGSFSSVASPIVSDSITEAMWLRDLDGDGDLDLVVASDSAFRGILVYLNDGQGGFSDSGLSFATGAVRDIAIGDIDGDGDLDLVTAEGISQAGAPTTRRFLNTINPARFAPNGTNVGNETNTTFGIALGDVNGNGHLDVVSANGTQPARLYLNDGHGGFPATGTAIDAGGATLFSPVLADVNGDGRPDLLLGTIGGTNRLHLNNGSGGFLPATAIGSETENSFSLAVGDVDGDGHPDVIVGNSNARNRLYLNDGSGGFPATGIVIGVETDNTYSVVLADINGDGHPDVIAGNSNQTNKLYLNNGSGGFLPAIAIGNDTDTTYRLAVGDLNGDGHLDVVAGNNSQTNKLYLNDGSGGFPASGTAIGSETDSTFALALVDVDGDGHLDVIAGNASGQQSKWYRNNGSGGFPATGTAIGSETDDTRALAVGDLDGDGDFDLVFGNFAQTNKRYLNGSRGAFRPARSLGNETDATQSVAIGDVNRDGYLDLIVGNSGQTNKLYLNQGGYFPATGIDVGSETDATFSVVLGDVNRNGYLDLVVGNSGQTNKLYLNDGSGGFPATGTPIGSDTDSTRSVVLGDINRNGRLDLVVGNQGQANKLHLNDGLGGFQAVGTAVGSSDTDGTLVVVLGDLNRDGHLDVVVGNTSGQTNKIYLNNGSGGFPASGTSLGSETGATLALALGDMNRNGALDVVAGNGSTTISNRIYLNNGSGGFPATGIAFGAVNEPTTSLALGDIDGDGDLDVIVGIQGGFSNRLFFNDGSGGLVNPIDLGPSSDVTRSVLLADIDRDGDLDLIVGNIGANRLHRFAHFLPAGTAVSTQVNTTPNSGDSLRAVNFSVIEAVNTASTRHTGIDYFLSNDGGANWYRAYSGEDLFFPASGTDLRWKAKLRTLSPGITPLLTQVSIDLVPTEPEAPAIAVALAGDASAEVIFGTVANNGSPITGYTATSDPGNLSGGCTDSPCIVTGLTNGTEYTFTLTATNGIGTGPASAPSQAVTPIGIQVIVFEALPDRLLGEPPFEVSATGGGSGNPVTFASQTEAVCATGGSHGSTVTLLARGTCTLRASQAGNDGYTAADDVEQSFAVRETPDAPTEVSATAGDASATVSFTVPADNGSPITGYTAISTPDSFPSSGCTASPCTVIGLTNGVEYTFTVTATSDVGTGPASAPSNAVTPQAPQVIVFDALPNRFLSEPPFEVSATGGDSGNPVTFASQTEAVCSTSGSDGSTVTLLAQGICTLRASQAGNDAFTAAPDVERSFHVLTLRVFGDGFEG